jgi:hypothetical protein
MSSSGNPPPSDDKSTVGHHLAPASSQPLASVVSDDSEGAPSVDDTISTNNDVGRRLSSKPSFKLTDGT